MSGTNSPANPLGLSDEEFLKLNGPPEAPASGEGGEGQGEGSDDGANKDGDAGTNGGEGDGQGDGNDGGDGEGDGQGSDDNPDGAGEGDDKGGEGGQDDDPDKKKEGGDAPSGKDGGEGGNLSKDKSQGKDPAGKKPADDKASESGKDKGKPAEGEGKKDGDASSSGSKADSSKETPPDYKALYEKVMAPLKANGKTIDIKSPEELIQLAQMGANYTRKMQAIAPHRKVLLMLENNGLLDEGKLSFLIDIEKKNPEAIKKLIKDAGMDPMDLDLDDPQAKPYLEGNHRVTDEEAGFRTILDELSSNPEGKATLQAITLWDQASKEVLWKQPDVMQLIHQQRESGIYDRINTELERQRALGQIPPNVPFLHAYKAIGDQMAEAGGFDDLVKPAPQLKQQQEQKAPVATTVAKPKPAVKNGDKANAASPTRTTSANGSKTVINPLALSDDEFMKQVTEWQGRL